MDLQPRQLAACEAAERAVPRARGLASLRRWRALCLPPVTGLVGVNGRRGASPQASQVSLGRGGLCTPSSAAPGGEQPYSFPRRALGSGPCPWPWPGWKGDAGAGAFHLQDTAWPLEQFSWPQPGQITTLGRAQRDNPGGGQSHRAPPSLGAGRVQLGQQAPASKLPSPPLGC